MASAVMLGCVAAPRAVANRRHPKRGVVEADLGAWKFRRFQPVLDVEVWVEDNKAEAFTASYVAEDAEKRGPRRGQGRRQRFCYALREGRRRVARDRKARAPARGRAGGYQVDETKIGGARALTINGHGEAWVMWAAKKHVVKVGGRGREDVPDAMVASYADRYPSVLPGGALEGAAARRAPSNAVKQEDEAALRSEEPEAGPRQVRPQEDRSCPTRRRTVEWLNAIDAARRELMLRLCCGSCSRGTPSSGAARSLDAVRRWRRRRGRGDPARRARARRRRGRRVHAAVRSAASRRTRSRARGGTSSPRRSRRACAMHSSSQPRGSARFTSARSSTTSTSRLDGVRLELRVTPLARVGLYVPGGTARYPSSVLMTAIPAKVAGVAEIVMVTPGASPEAMLAARLARVDRVFELGGAQAIGALAYGTASVPRVDKIVGPGNAWVASAKRQVYGEVDIDSIAGPSEVLIIADDGRAGRHGSRPICSRRPSTIARRARSLVTTSAALAAAVAARGRRAARDAAAPRDRRARDRPPRRGGDRRLDRRGDRRSRTGSRPSTSSSMSPSARAVAARCTTAGAIFVGKWSSEAAGDYLAGANHVLPTGGAARYASPLGVHDFRKRTSLDRVHARGRRARTPTTIAALAACEGLDAHGRSALLRRKRR